MPACHRSESESGVTGAAAPAAGGQTRSPAASDRQLPGHTDSARLRLRAGRAECLSRFRPPRPGHTWYPKSDNFMGGKRKASVPLFSGESSTQAQNAADTSSGAGNGNFSSSEPAAEASGTAEASGAGAASPLTYAAMSSLIEKAIKKAKESSDTELDKKLESKFEGLVDEIRGIVSGISF